MKTISVLDTKVASSNLGDGIIMDAVNGILSDIFENDFFINMPTHDVIGKHSYNFLKQSDYAFVGGTNLLSSNMFRHNQWKVSLYDSLFINNITLMGVGWCKYQGKVNSYTRLLYKRLLAKDVIHSVRDSYTEKMLKSAGIKNVINTACPTMWGLDEAHCKQIPTEKSDSVVVTFTEYNQNYEYDNKLIEILDKNYNNIYYWTQQPHDYEYMKTIGGDRIQYLSPNIDSLNEVFNNNNVDYIGTRLHAGVRALQKKKRTLILGVDNRATEISRDTNLPVIDRINLQDINTWINSKKSTQIHLPTEDINSWKKQFANSL
ncbi:polysaccharide pyruvyl transferase family protein [Bacillus sp. WLY-B-L8]|uniref:polysaccharide pyruvyl transferase family protein n=1 Tax=Bacillus multifaciens TaxID=3068506 RepID=UPI0027429B4B|nr:polysaccharide pyruvyl transferase family protein [Bacillus sp. WLY-B-L8]MDP7978344.1 polysaccharide pyruvyl transferase family protein [Bacillus sp. WLY-B-L8]